MRIDYEPGYRVYFVSCGKQLIILLAGGDKPSQASDIQTGSRPGEEPVGTGGPYD